MTRMRNLLTAGALALAGFIAGATGLADAIPVYAQGGVVAPCVSNLGCGGGSGGSSIIAGTTTSTAAAGSTFYSDGTLVQALQMQALLAGNICTSAVGTDAYACSPPTPQACTGMTLATAPPVYLVTDVVNTGPATFAYCGLAAKAIVKPVGASASTVMVTGDMLAAIPYLLVYNATGDNWKLLSNMTGEVVAYDGTVATPAFRGTATTTGLSFPSNVPTISVGGGGKFTFGASNTTLSDLVPDATVNNRNLGVTGQRFLNVFAAGWLIGTQGEMALNADYTNSTATFSATALSATVTSGQTYSFVLHLTFADSTAADGAQFDFNGGAATVTNFRVHCYAFNNVGGVVVLTNGATTALATAVQATLALTTQTDITCEGTFVPSSTNTFIVRAAQTAHTAGTLTVHRGSWLSMRDARPL